MKNQIHVVPQCQNSLKTQSKNHRNMGKQNRYSNTHIHDRSLCGLGTGTSIKSGEVKVVLWPKPQPSVRRCVHVSTFHMVVICRPSHNNV
jgi:hypothetical protein